MAMFTVITRDNRVLRINAKSVQHLTRLMIDVGLKWQGIHEDREEKPRGKKQRRRPA